VHHLFLSQSTRVTDGRTDRQNDDSQDRPRICSRGNKPTDIESGSDVRRLLVLLDNECLRLKDEVTELTLKSVSHARH